LNHHSGRRSLLITKLAGDKEVTALQDTQTGRNRDSIKVLDLERLDILPFMLDPALEQISIFRLQEKEEGSL
jgi:hypothetical protein